ARYVFAVAKDMLQMLRGATEPVAAPDLAWAVRSTPSAESEPFCEFHHQWSSIDAHVRVEQIATLIDLQARLSDAGAPLTRGPATAARSTASRPTRTARPSSPAWPPTSTSSSSGLPGTSWA